MPVYFYVVIDSWQWLFFTILQDITSTVARNPVSPAHRIVEYVKWYRYSVHSLRCSETLLDGVGSKSELINSISVVN